MQAVLGLKGPRCAGVSTVVLGLLLPQLAAASEFAANRVDAEPKIDGRLDESAWANAPVHADFVQRSPHPGQAPPVRTEVRLLYSEDTLFVGVTSRHDPGESPRALELNPDSFSVFSDDAISLKFDVRRDQRTTVAFVTNPGANRTDYVAVDGGGFRMEVDLIWRVSTHKGEDFWSAEFAIPFLSLGMREAAGPRKIGFAVTRDHAALRGTYDLPVIPPEFGPVSAINYGVITGIRDVSAGRPLTLLPYALLGYRKQGGFRWSAGGEARYRLGPDVYSELTILTDFAEVEFDDPVLNLDRFPLFLPERRPFFLSGVDVFDVGSSGLAQVFFSRRIGLDTNGNNVPLLGGLKAYGTVNQTRFGVLQGVTLDTDEAPARSYTVARVRQNFGRRGHIGTIATLFGALPSIVNNFQGDPDFEPNYSFGVDGSVRGFSQRLSLAGFWAETVNTEGQLARGRAGELSLTYRLQEAEVSVIQRYISSDFDPSVGFVLRQDFLQSRGSLQWILRPEAQSIDALYFTVFGTIDRAASDGRYLGQFISGSARGLHRFGWDATATLNYKEDVVRDGFELSVAGRNVAPGTYRGLEANISLGTPATLNPQGSINYRFSNAFFGGDLHEISASARIGFGSHVNLSGSATQRWFLFEDTPVVQAFTMKGRLQLAASTDLVLDILVQGNTAGEQLAALARLRWQYLPGSELFLVYREQLDLSDEADDQRSITLKVSFRYDLGI